MIVRLHGGPRAGQTAEVRSVYDVLAVARGPSWRELMIEPEGASAVALPIDIGTYAWRNVYPAPLAEPAFFWRGWGQ